MGLRSIARRREDALARLHVLDTPRERGFDLVTEIAGQVCDAPVSLVSFVQTDRQWFKARCGLDLGETAISQSICAHAVTADEFLMIPDTQADERTRDNSLCVGETAFRFYAGAVVRTPEGVPVGTVCVLDRRPRTLDSRQVAVLELLARQVETLLQMRRTPGPGGAHSD